MAKRIVNNFNQHGTQTGSGRTMLLQQWVAHTLRLCWWHCRCTPLWWQTWDENFQQRLFAKYEMSNMGEVRWFWEWKLYATVTIGNFGYAKMLIWQSLLILFILSVVTHQTPLAAWEISNLWGNSRWKYLLYRVCFNRGFDPVYWLSKFFRKKKKKFQPTCYLKIISTITSSEGLRLSWDQDEEGWWWLIGRGACHSHMWLVKWTQPVTNHPPPLFQASNFVSWMLPLLLFLSNS